MKSNEQDYSNFESIDHINASMAMNELTSELEEQSRVGLPWITCAEVRKPLEREQAKLFKTAQGLSDEWEKSREECGRAPTYPGAIMTRQAPNLDHFTAQAVMLAKALESYQLGKMLATCDLISDALEDERETVKTLSRQVEVLEAKAGESDALRGQIEAMKTTIRILENSQANTQTMLKDAKEQLNRIEKKTDGIPALVEESRDETEKALRLTEAVLKELSITSFEERKVYFGNANGKTQAAIAKELKCKKDHVIYLTKKINAKLQRARRPKMSWNNTTWRRENIKPIEEYSTENQI